MFKSTAPYCRPYLCAALLIHPTVTVSEELHIPRTSIGRMQISLFIKLSIPKRLCPSRPRSLLSHTHECVSAQEDLRCYLLSVGTSLSLSTNMYGSEVQSFSKYGEDRHVWLHIIFSGGFTLRRPWWHQSRLQAFSGTIIVIT